MADDAVPRFMRFVAEFEIEVTDLVQAAAFTFDVGQDGEGEPVLMPYEDACSRMQAVIGQVVPRALREEGPRAGFRWLGGSVLPRHTGPDGNYVAFTLAERPGRREDGSLATG